ncbi:hypothetical protein DH2020_002517 [Rehmannia glutinosa]|uniref:Mannosyltransferase n=1 Tax=Rehmannia glutinosa TaxID=99300 RepID=A0ABR0XUG7_REHGL
MALNSKFMQLYGYDVLLGSIAAFYVFMTPYTKVEESFNVQYDHLEFPGVVPRTFIGEISYTIFSNAKHALFLLGALIVSTLASPFVLSASLLQLPKIYSLYAVGVLQKYFICKGYLRKNVLCHSFTVNCSCMPDSLTLCNGPFAEEYTVCNHNLLEEFRLVLGCIILSTLRFFRIQVAIKKNFGSQVEAFFVILTALQFHMLFYSTRPLPNILAFGLVNLAYGYWFKGSFYAALNSLICATIVFRCDILLLVSPLGLELLLTHAFHWYFTSALPRSLLAAYPLFVLGVLLDRRVLFYIIPVLSFVLLYSKLPHKELRFIISSLPMFNLSAAVAASRMYVDTVSGENFRIVLLFILCSAIPSSLSVKTESGFTNLPSIWTVGSPAAVFNPIKCNSAIGFLWFAYAPKGEEPCYLLVKYKLETAYAHATQTTCWHLKNNSKEVWVHVDTFSAMNGISRFCENDEPWRFLRIGDRRNHVAACRVLSFLTSFLSNRYSKEEGIPLQEFQSRNFTYLLSEHALINGYKCLFSIKGFSGARVHAGFPPISLNREKTVAYGNLYGTEKWLLLTIDKRLVLFLVFVITALELILTRPAIHLFVVLAASVPIVMVHAVLSKRELDVIVHEGDGELARLVQEKLGDDGSMSENTI